MKVNMKYKPLIRFGTFFTIFLWCCPYQSIAIGMSYTYDTTSIQQRQNKKTKYKMQKNIYNYGSTLIRFNGSKLEWSDNNGTTWYLKSWRWYPGFLNSPSGVYDVLQWKNELLAFTTHGIYSSKNGCQTWDVVVSSWPQTVNVHHLEVVGDEIISISDKGVYSSKNGGRTWDWKASKW